MNSDLPNPTSPASSTGFVSTVLFVVDGLGLSGKTKSLVDVATNLHPDRYRAEVCTLTDETGPLVERLRRHGIPLHYVSCPDGVNLGVVVRLMRLMRSIHPKVVHCYNPRPIIYGGLAAKLLGIPGRVGTLSAFACLVPDRTYGFLPQRLATLSRRNIYRNRVAVGLMRRLVTVSPSLGERFCRYNGVALSKLRVVPYAVDVDKMWIHPPAEVTALRQTIGAPPDDVLVGSVGRLVEQKDYPTQFRAFALAAKQEPRLRMVLAGEGPLQGELVRLALELGVLERICFLGHWEKVPLLLRCLDVFVIASKFEPYGVALLEAKAAGLAIAATRVNEVPEIIGDMQSGLLATPEDPESLAGVFITLAKDGDLRRRLGQKALQEARERNSLQAMLDGYQMIYDEIRGTAPLQSRSRVATTVNLEKM